MRGLIVFGEKGSGKDTVARLINEYSSKNVSFFNIGDLCRDMSCMFLATDKWSNSKREFYVETAKKLKEIDIDFLSYYVVGKILEKFKCTSLNDIGDNELIIVTGGRTEEDYSFWKERNFGVVGIHCDEEIRQQRLMNRDGYTQNSIDSLEKNTKEIIKRADYTLDNSGDLDQLKEVINIFVKEWHL